jgi:hypothetical protein
MKCQYAAWVVLGDEIGYFVVGLIEVPGTHNLLTALLEAFILS